MTFVGTDEALTEDEKKRISSSITEPPEKATVDLKIQMTKECYFCGNKVSYWLKGALIIFNKNGQEIRCPICPKCVDLIQLFFKKRPEGAKQ